VVKILQSTHNSKKEQQQLIEFLEDLSNNIKKKARKRTNLERITKINKLKVLLILCMEQ
jgi:hypothetical protein